MGEEEKVPLLLDTDIGSDIDDAVCLSYLLNQPRCELLGVTTVSGEAEKRAALADAIIRAKDEELEIPVHPGTEKPLLVEQRQTRAQQASVLEEWPHREDFQPGRAAEFARRQIRERPGEVTLLAVGPLTNVALLFALDPEIPSLLDRLVLMNGRFFSGRAEWNARLDPHAAAMVYHAPVDELIAVGLDVTLECRAAAPEARGKLKGRELDLVREMAEVWFERSEEIVFHDPLAGAVVFEEELCSYERAEVKVELVGERSAGMTFLEKEGAGRRKVAKEVRKEDFLDHLWSTLNPNSS